MRYGLKSLVVAAVAGIAAAAGYFALYEFQQRSVTPTQRAEAERERLDGEIRAKCRVAVSSDTTDASAQRDWCREKGYLTYDERHESETLSE